MRRVNLNLCILRMLGHIFAWRSPIIKLFTHFNLRGLKPTAACDRGFESEDAEHYFFFCNRFTQQRTSLFQAIRKFQPVGIRLLLYGSPDLSDDDNVELFSYVQHFIKETNRF